MFNVNEVTKWWGNLAVIKRRDGIWLVDWTNPKNRRFFPKSK